MSDAFLSSDDFDEQAHQLYNEGRYDEALLILKEGITLYPHAVELHIGRAYAHLAREEYAWARASFKLIFRRTVAVTARQSFTVSTESNSASLSSCMSLL